tara:strand:+ start:1291 stop:2238 length:948 start_codon:yes stop_codon:yes gene_type:complete
MRLIERAIPQTLNDLVGLDKLVEDVEGWENEGSYPQALLFHGPPGIGKTSAATVIARTMLGEHFNEMNFIETNASDDRGIDFIRSELKFAMRAKSIGAERKVVLLDEADGLTPTAQDAMRQIIEKYSKNAMLILTCNDLEKVRPAIRSRCKTYAFKPVSESAGANRLSAILGREWHAYWFKLDELLRRLTRAMNGDIRACVMFLDGMAIDTLQERIELLEAMASDDNAELIVKDEWHKLRRNLHALLDSGAPLHNVLSGFYRNMRKHFDDEVYPVLWPMMAVYGDVLVHKHTWSGDDYSYLDYMVAKMKKESERI